MMSRFTLRQLEYFVAAAETSSTTDAAERLHITQSAMSAALTDLERALDVTLFVRRRGRGIALTSQGRELLVSARELLHGAEELASRATDLQANLSGSLRVGCFATIMPAVLAPLLGAFQARFPEIQIDFLEGTQAELGAALLEGAIELAITFDHDLPHGVTGELLVEQAPHVLLAADHRFANAQRVSLATIASEPFILLNAEPASTLQRATFARAGLQPNIRYSSRNWDHIRALIQFGLGYSLYSQPLGAVPPLHWHPSAVGVPLAEAMPAPPILVATRSEGRLTRRGQAFREFCFAEGRQALVGDRRPPTRA